MSNVIDPQDRDDIPGITEGDLRLPISERFFSGGATTLRGFGYEEAGPREVVPDCTGQPNFATCFKNFGTFRDNDGNIIRLDPFTVPIGGNAMAIANLEARIPLTRYFQLVPFYDGGNVYRSVGEMFGKKDSNVNPNLRSKWTHTVGIGFGVRTPFGGNLSIDYGFLLNPPEFTLPQGDNTTAIYKLRNSRIHFRFTRSF
jgi:outer membrane protein insertion porin family